LQFGEGEAEFWVALHEAPEALVLSGAEECVGFEAVLEAVHLVPSFLPVGDRVARRELSERSVDAHLVRADGCGEGAAVRRPVQERQHDIIT